MKLRQKVNTFYLLLLGILLPLLILCNYVIFEHLHHQNVERALYSEQQRIAAYINQNNELPYSPFIHSQQKRAPQDTLNLEIRDTLLSATKNKLLVYGLEHNGAYYKITLKYPVAQTQTAWWLIASSNGCIVGLLFLGIYTINSRLYMRVWQPFFKNIMDLKRVDVSNNHRVQFQQTPVQEFEQLNQIISELITQIKKDYQNLKEFNQNISHEIQTPITIARNKVVLLLESKNLDDQELKRLEAIYQQINKLSKISKSLTLISRIENQEFKNFDDVNVPTVIKNMLNNLEEIINFKGIDVQLNLEPTRIESDHILIDILITNLIKNAIQHNKQQGFISIALKDKALTILNSGNSKPITKDKIFNRFERGNPQSKSLGLGLAISQNICKIYNYKLTYSKLHDNYQFKVQFK